MTDRRPGDGRYAQLEREQRWLVGSIPPDVRPVARITDRYIHGTTVRLRRVDGIDGTTYKLGQKVRIDATDPERVMLTNLYLTAPEYDIFARLPADELSKERSHVDHDGHTLAVDSFTGPLAGLVLAEVELPKHAELISAPSFVVRDVTSDDRYSGGRLASATDAEIAALL